MGRGADEWRSRRCLSIWMITNKAVVSVSANRIALRRACVSNVVCVCAEGEAECGAEGSGGDAESPPRLPPFGYAHPALSPSHSRSYQELRPAAHARDMQTYAHLEEVFKPGTPGAAGSTDGVYLRRSSPELSPEPERRDDFRHYEPYAPAAPPPYSHDHHHHVDG